MDRDAAGQPPDLPTDRFRQITNHLRDVVWLVDPNFEDVQYVNPAYADLLGRPVEGAAADLKSLDFVHPEDRERAESWLSEIQADFESGDVREEYPVELRVETAEGQTRWVETVGVPVRDAVDDLVGFAGIVVDVTDRVKRERTLEEQVERLDQFASVVSHDLRNPLATAMGRLELYRDGGEEAHVEEAIEALERIEELSVDLLALARHGSTAHEAESVSLADAVREAWSNVDTRSATLRTETGGAIEADESQLRTLLENLFRNAVGHGGDDVTVSVGDLADGFYVADDGPGIPPDEREAVFEHGYTTGYGGTGVGLSIVARVAEAHGWTVELTESASGGARFEFRRGDDGRADPSSPEREQ